MTIDLEMKKLFEDRARALFREYNEQRKIKNYIVSDKLRSQINELGFIIQDTKEVSRLFPHFKNKNYW